MKKHCCLRFCLWLGLSVALSGCELIFQAGPALSGKAREDYLKSIKAYIEYWEKPGMTQESRLKDWRACGGGSNGSFGVVSQDRRPGESQDDAQNRQRFTFQRCMLRSGYRYTGDCSSDYMKARPLCGAP